MTNPEQPQPLTVMDIVREYREWEVALAAIQACETLDLAYTFSAGTAGLADRAYTLTIPVAELDEGQDEPQQGEEGKA